MAAYSLGGALNVEPFASCTDVTRTKYGRKEPWFKQTTVSFPSLMRPWRSKDSPLVKCAPLSTNNLKGSSEINSRASHAVPSLLEVESLLNDICNTNSISEFNLKFGGFHLYVLRKSDVKVNSPLPCSLPTTTNTAPDITDINGSVATTSLAISKTKPSVDHIQRLIDTATDEGLVILQSPKVGFFQTSKTIKGKRAPPSCEENQMVKEGQVLCYVEQLGGEIPIESDVSGEIVKILRKDGEPIGYGDALIAILPSFPGIKKLQ
ncbi:hypothetical protein H6P81_004197 [Aristolochia fimbriata]|uniref:Lipoyl-binding domain-containing protein n=1 Tax=Aristolochia fimbriata TaxID=158543 RepID=A0AAV7FF83_ARIFI|nr:hypothetical protein H6P81_004197 [Aristolochia fimbriata]